jgi:hypothetical protein
MSSHKVMIVAGLVLAIVAGTGLLVAKSIAAPSQTLDHKAFLPLTWRGVARADVPAPPTRTTTPVVNASPTATTPAATATATTEPPSPTPVSPSGTPTTEPPTATPTEEPAAGRIHGRYTVDGQPLEAGFGAEGLPQIELRRCSGAECVKVDNVISAEGGTFEFLNPVTLAPGEWYQVWWLNIDPLFGREWVYDWRSRRITDYQAGEDIDLGAMEIGNMLLKAPCNDCGQSLPITFKWDTRANKTDVYRWSLMHRCGDPTERVNALQSQALGHRGEYTINGVPSGFRYDERYCWFIFIEDGQKGTGSTYEQYVIQFLRTPAVAAER